jgi:uncharacterized protein YjbI with pentapeptide repeats
LTGHIKREILLGHFRAEDEISHDRQHWTPLAEHQELVPKIMTEDLDDPLVKDRLTAARRWADDSDQDSTALLSNQTRYDPDHSDGQYFDDIHHATMLQDKLKQTRHDRWLNNILMLIFLSTIAGIIYFYFSRAEPVNDIPIDCRALPSQGINLNNCFLQGVTFAGMDIRDAQLMNVNLMGADLQATNLSRSDLSYSILSMANLQEARLVGAKLVGVDFNATKLDNADLHNADLSYANLNAATINGIDITGAKLDHTRWIDGRICQSDSIGACR